MTKLVPKKPQLKIHAQGKPKIVLPNEKKVILQSSDLPKKQYTDLWQVMDYTKEFSIFYSGVESESYFNHVYEMGVRDFLVSYEYMKGKGSRLTKRFENLKDVRLFVDSGAFTIFNNPDEYKDYTEEMWEKRIIEYLKWAERHKDIIFTIADLDLQDELGIELITKWRRKFFEPFMLRTGIPVCFVWHEIDGHEGWERMCQRYPYVATSLVSDDLSLADLKAKFKVAEKYNTLIQGMGSTRTSILPDFPFYTADSTSWKVGMRYGLLSVWDGKMVKQYKKEEWDSKAIPVIENYKDIVLDIQKIKEEDVGETIRANVYPYMKAEEFIRERHKKLIYWQKPRAAKVDVDNLPPGFFPSIEWVQTPSMQGDYDEYAKRMNINSELEQQAVIDIIVDMTVFLNWNDPAYAEFIQRVYFGADRLIESLHDEFINRIVENDDERIEDLQNFYKSCLSGDNDRLLLLGTNFDKAVKERDHYLEEELYEYEDVSSMEVANVLSSLKLLPDKESEAPEIDELDKEIFRQTSIAPYRNKKGEIIGGKKQVGRPKKIYSDKYPKFNCDNCFQAAKCEHYKPGHICIYNKLFKRFDTRNATDIIQAMQSLVDFNLERTQRAMIMEMMSGMIDPNVTGLVNQNMSLLTNLNRLYETSNPEILRQTRVIRSDGTQEDTLEVTNPSQGSILEKMFRNIKHKDEVVVEAAVDPVEKTEAGEVIIDTVV